jgi:hypothetical protein
VFDASAGETFRTWLDQKVFVERPEAVESAALGSKDHAALVAAYALASREGEESSARAGRLPDEIDKATGRASQRLPGLPPGRC